MSGKYCQMDSPRQAYYRVSVKALIRNPEAKILFVRENGVLSIPGGGWDHGESIHECLARELTEEVSFVGEFRETLIHTQTIYNDAKQAWVLWLAYSVECDNFSFSAGIDAESIAWLSEAEIPDSRSGIMVRNVLESQKSQA